MKKKLSLFLLTLFVLPVFAFFGCEDLPSWDITVSSSWVNAGEVVGQGTYDEGETVTLTATAKPNNNFIAWVFQDSTLISDNETFKIVNTQNSQQEISKSTLTFTMSKERQGNYTAVFDETYMEYAKLTNFYITDNLTSTPELDMGTQETTFNSNISIRQGEKTVFIQNNLPLKNNVLFAPTEFDQILYLSTEQHIIVSANLQNSYAARTIDFRTTIDVFSNTAKTEMEGYSYEVTYSEGSYKIVFEFDFNINDSDSKTYYLILNYDNLNK
ncbi:MAG: immunoglobulin domain-containing protein [Clostridiales bacterium]|nr:immunoglobulin domain-containing protein [Clostridiales bacterium]